MCIICIFGKTKTLVYYELLSTSPCEQLRDKRKRADVLAYLNNFEYNIICLQETHWMTEDIKDIKTDYTSIFPLS